MKSTRGAATCVAIVMSACNTESSYSEEASDVGDRPVARSERGALPISGGALLVSADGKLAIATDPDRDAIHVVDLEANAALAAISLPNGSRPFRAASDAQGRVHVTLRGTGVVATVDPAAGKLLSTTAVCSAPRGIAFDERRGLLHVACAGGELVGLDAGTLEVTRRIVIAPDLRDVVIAGDRVLVSRFRTAEIYEVADDGTVALVGVPESLRVGNDLRVPNTAWRLLATAKGSWVMLHQLATTAPLPGDDLTANLPDGGDGYGGRGVEPCDGASNPALSAALPGGVLSSIGAIPEVAMAVDVAIAPDGEQLVVASPSQHERDEPDLARGLVRASLRDLSRGPGGECRTPGRLEAADDFVAVAFDHDGEVLALSRTKPKLYRFEGNAVERAIELQGETLRDTGHDLFHLDAGAGIACATCHAEGGDDGLVWTFADVGPRRTPSLDVGLAGTEPFHWSGDLENMPTLIEEVRHRRMGGAPQSPEHADALAQWLFELPGPPVMRVAADADARAGEALFAELGCARCHSGAALTSSAFVDLGMGALQVPSLRGVAMRPPYMHDGRAPDLAASVIEMLGATPDARTPSDAEVTAIVAYLETL